MGFHHVAIATADMAATHHFYTSAMGFELVHVEAGDTDVAGSWFRHVFYDTGDGSLLAFFELHDDRFAELDLAISRGLGLPSFVNHLAFDAPDLEALDAARDRWLSHGLDVARIDHGNAVSIYAEDPNGNMLEWCCWTLPFDARNKAAAERLLQDSNPPRSPAPDLKFFLASEHDPE
jgi:catechol 2,3-dioxygenase-like lactoylglutathione lyase family enzyme